MGEGRRGGERKRGKQRKIYSSIKTNNNNNKTQITGELRLTVDKWDLRKFRLGLSVGPRGWKSSEKTAYRIAKNLLVTGMILLPSSFDLALSPLIYLLGNN